MMVKSLGRDGVSDDETDDELPPASLSRAGNKTVRRVRLSWINRDISQLFDSVESYRDANIHLKHQQAKGQSAPLRLFMPMKESDESRKPVHGLPRNWYDAEYYLALQPAQQRMLGAIPDHHIPVLVRSQASLQPYGTDGWFRNATQNEGENELTLTLGVGRIRGVQYL